MRHYSHAIVLAMISLLFFSCQQEVDLSVTEKEDMQPHSVRARMDLRIGAFDATRAGESHEWKEGDIIYLLYTTESGTTGGNAVYSAFDATWTVNYYGRLLRDQSAKVQAYWFDGAGSSSESTVTLLPTTGVYHDANGSYIYPTGGDLTVSLSLSPSTSRIRFKGASGTEFSVASGITTCTGYDINKGVLSTTASSVSSSISSEGYSPYLYGTFTDGTSPSLTIVNGGRFYRTECPNTMFRVGESGWMNLPSLTSRNGWELVVPITGLTLDKSSASLEPGGTIQLNAIVTPSDATNTSFKWTSSDESVATVSSTGLVTGVKNGSATITCAAQDGSGKTTTCLVRVSENKTFTVSGVTFNMIKVEAGTFTMGDASYASPTHQVTISKDYYIGETEVTQALWYAVMGQKPTSDGSKWTSSYGLGDNYPAYYISWDDCQSFVSRLNTLTGMTFRMPTEAEWEYAARGGSKSKGCTYSGSNTPGDVAWYKDNSNDKTHEVRGKSPNELGLYDMSGNVWEWCSDWYGSYSSSAVTDPTGATSGSSRVLRGGSWDDSAEYCRVAIRCNLTPTNRFNLIGFRLVLQF